MESPKDVERESPWRPGQQRGKEESAEGERGNSPRVQKEYKSPCSYVWGGGCPCYLPCHHHPKAGLKSLHQNYSSISTFQVCPTNPITTHQHSDRRNDLRTGPCWKMGKPQLEKCQDSSLAKCKCVHAYSGAWKEKMSQKQSVQQRERGKQEEAKRPSRKLES